MVLELEISIIKTNYTIIVNLAGLNHINRKGNENEEVENKVVDGEVLGIIRLEEQLAHIHFG